MIFACISCFRNQSEFGTTTFGPKPICGRETEPCAAVPAEEAQEEALTYHV